MTAVSGICHVDLCLPQSKENLKFASHFNVIPLQGVVSCVTRIVVVPEMYFSERKC